MMAEMYHKYLYQTLLRANVPVSLVRLLPLNPRTHLWEKSGTISFGEYWVGNQEIRAEIP